MDKQINAVIDAYQTAWNNLDFAALEELWLADEADIYYVAEEFERPLHTFDQVREYWRLTRAAVERVTMSSDDRRCKFLQPDLAVVTYEMHVDISMQGHAQQGIQAIGVDLHVSAILRQTSPGWRFIHYVEAPLGALPFVRRAYMANGRS